MKKLFCDWCDKEIHGLGTQTPPELIGKDDVCAACLQAFETFKRSRKNRNNEDTGSMGIIPMIQRGLKT